jgi:hypothetical protein
MEHMEHIVIQATIAFLEATARLEELVHFQDSVGTIAPRTRRNRFLRIAVWLAKS